jgi:Tol biopolymer transport system component
VNFAEPMDAPGQPYTVTIRAGAAARSGRRLIADLTWMFTARAPRVVYLAPAISPTEAAAPPSNLWLVDPAAPGDAAQLTRGTISPADDYRPSPDGSQIAYSKPMGRGTSDIFVLNMATGAERRVVNCAPVQARCINPEWAADGVRLAYERAELDPALAAEDRDKARAWLVNLRDLGTAPLLTNTLYLGGGPKWSPDMRQIAVHDRNLGGIAVYDLLTGEQKRLPTEENAVDAYQFAPDGVRFVYLKLTFFGSMFSSELELADLQDPAAGVRKLSGADRAVVEDKQPVWWPGRAGVITFTRRYLDGSGARNAQIYTVDTASGTLGPLLQDPDAARYFHGAVSWSPAGDKLLMQRLPVADFGAADDLAGAPGIWVYDPASGALTQIADNGYFPRWLP